MEKENNLYRSKSLKRIASPDQLDDHIRIAKPGVWMLIAALALVLAGALVWGFLGKMPTTTYAAGVLKRNAVLCFVTPDQSYSMEPGMDVRVALRSYASDEYGSMIGTVETIANKPLSLSDATTLIGDAFAAESVLMSNWSILVSVRLTPDEDSSNGASWSNAKGRNLVLQDNMVCDATIILDQTRPIDLLFGN